MVVCSSIRFLRLIKQESVSVCLKSSNDSIFYCFLYRIEKQWRAKNSVAKWCSHIALQIVAGEHTRNVFVIDISRLEIGKSVIFKFISKFVNKQVKITVQTSFIYSCPYVVRNLYIYTYINTNLKIIWISIMTGKILF